MINNDDKASITKTLIVWDDLDYAVRWWGSDWHINFDVLKINAREAKYYGKERDGEWAGTKGMPDGMCLELKDAKNGTDQADTLDDAEIYVHGMIKWDGCSHLSFPATETCMWHVCGLHSWLAVANLMARLPKVLGPLMSKWDVDAAT